MSKTNEIKALRRSTGLSQAKFAKRLGIPVRTIQNWEIGQMKPPNYVIRMIKTQLEGSGMINIDTVIFVDILNKLAKATKTEDGKEWILPFSQCTSDNCNDHLFYDDANPQFDEHDTNPPMRYEIMRACCLENGKHEIISTYTSYLNNNVTIQYHEEGYIEVVWWNEFHDGLDDAYIIIRDGEWHLD